uniref:F-box domain-containing protein n=1 Tax=Panagrolaimus sp. ES5 TaxID=591445 RepID=A0AC34FJ94_9BILA
MVVPHIPPTPQTSWFGWVPRFNEPSFPYNTLPDVVKARFFELLTPAQAWQLGQVSKSLRAQKNLSRHANPRIVDYLILDAAAMDADDFKEEFGWKHFNGLTITSDGYAVLSLQNVQNLADIENVHVIRGISLRNFTQNVAENILNTINYTEIERFQFDGGKIHRYHYGFFQEAKRNLGFKVFVGHIRFDNDPPSPLNSLQTFMNGLEAFKICCHVALNENDEREMDNYFDNTLALPSGRIGYLHIHLPDNKHMYFYKNYSVWDGVCDSFAEKSAIIFGYTRNVKPQFFM